MENKEKEKVTEKELIEAIRELTNELKHERQEDKVPESIQSFINFLKTQKGKKFLKVFCGFMAFSYCVGDIYSRTGIPTESMFNEYYRQLENL